MREEVIVQLRSLVRQCKFDFKKVALELQSFCQKNQYLDEAKIINETLCREYFSKDYAGVPAQEIPTVLAAEVAANVVVDKDPIVKRQRPVEPIESSAEDTKEVLDEVETALPSTVFSIFDIIESENFDTFMNEIETELDMRADPKSEGNLYAL